MNGGGWQEGGGDDNALTLSDSLFLDGAWFGSNENAASLTGNRFLDGPATAPPAISVGLNDGTFTDNLITGYSTGMALGGFIELGLVQGNVVAHSGTGIEVDQIGVGTIRGNLLVGNRADGLLVEPDAAAAPGAVEDNIAAMNGGDGIALALNPGASSGSWAATVSANLAIGNGGYGIDSPGTQPRVAVTDGGGNMAFGNGSPGQCRDIASAP
ncbi:MAG TPA: right-handed parallel beta-helix repeat-containing protein [Actinomycetota bacterium]|nr:right-handed parallel beta-helix repeat-containing protein [Actinomycetota bacterium]